MCQSLHSVGRRVGQALRLVDPDPPDTRTVFVHRTQPSDAEAYISQRFPDNRVVTAKYTIYNFLPKNLFEQFRRIANFYFLCVAIIQFTIPDSPIGPGTSVAPLAFVVVVTALKQAYEDFLRHRSDKEVNDRPVSILHEGKIEQIRSHRVQVGDVLRVADNEDFPCDLLLLASSDPKGECYVTTASLDGETNLKILRSVTTTKRKIEPRDMAAVRATIQCEQPQPNLYEFVGRIRIQGGEQESLGPEQLLLRGARLKNTQFIFGVAVNTGCDTKMALNSRIKSNKFSTVEKRMNRFLIFFLLLLLVETTICTTLSYWYADRKADGTPWYIPTVAVPTVGSVVVDFFSFLVIFNYIIPISLYVTIEMQKFIGSKFFQWDIEMFREETGEPAKANTSDLNEELGQVEYLMTDKTGTLTENDMCFRYCSIDGAQYLEQQHKFVRKDDGVVVENYSDSERHFIEALVLCHNAHVNIKADGSHEFQASSPDEKALLEFCTSVGVVFNGLNDEGMLCVDFNEEQCEYELLEMLDFDSTRKCMSVIVRRLETNNNRKSENLMFCKGAEAALMPKSVSGNRHKTMEHLTQFAEQGLRTLLVGMRVLSDDELRQTQQMLLEAKTSLDNRQDKLWQAYKTVESNLHLLGATGVEDRLQDGVPETLVALRRAGIKVWILTGDKEETAVNVSHSCGHIEEGQTTLKLTGLQNGEQCMETMRNMTVDSSTALVVDGRTLVYALDPRTPQIFDLFRDLCLRCTSVLCCRMSPLQKAQVVKMVRQSPGHPITAAIGDGANDASMIQEADVGIGIFGKEGRQAARVADFAFGRFNYLRRALLVHGFYFYSRIATLVQYFFYKNVVFSTSQVYFAIFSMFSAQTIYDSSVLTLYNITFTSLPILLYGLFEQNRPQQELLDQPALYQIHRRNSRLSWLQFFLWFLNALWHNAVCFFGTYTFFWLNGGNFAYTEVFGIWTYGGTVIIGIVLLVNTKLTLETSFWAWMTPVGYAVTFVGFFAVLFFYNGVIIHFLDNGDYYWIYFELMKTPTSWLLWALFLAAGLLPDLVFKGLQNVGMQHAGPVHTQHTNIVRPAHHSKKTHPRAWNTDGERKRSDLQKKKSQPGAPNASNAPTAPTAPKRQIRATVV